MTTRDVTDIAASVHQRLLNLARSSHRPFNELLQRFAIERFLYRLSRSPHAHFFVLKGALMFVLWRDADSRPTLDIDLSCPDGFDAEVIADMFRDVCQLETEPDGLVFDSSTIKATLLKKDIGPQGVRIRLTSHLGRALVWLQIDVGFGDVITPPAENIAFPGLLDFPSAILKGYSMETTIAEKYHAMVKLGLLNSRVKDYYDIWTLAWNHDFDGTRLSSAITSTFRRRKTAIDTGGSRLFDMLVLDRTKQVQWRSFIRKSGITDAPVEFSVVVVDLRQFLLPLAETLITGSPFSLAWKAPGPWQ